MAYANRIDIYQGPALGKLLKETFKFETFGNSVPTIMYAQISTNPFLASMCKQHPIVSTQPKDAQSMHAAELHQQLDGFPRPKIA